MPADSMAQAFWKKVEGLFASAAGMPPGERWKFLEREVRGDAELLAELNELLSNDLTQSDTIESLVMRAARMIADSVIAIEGARIGAYRIVRLIGEGGMATVYEAVREDSPSEPHVALKMGRPGTISETVSKRLLNEIKILGSLDNPLIARLLDCGEWLPRGDEPPVPYIVIEWVDGENILGYCGHYGLSVRARLKLFLKVLSAVSYVHQKMVVHCDLKPSHILVAKDGTPHLLDFGIAQPVGEAQAHEDVHSLGLVLFELLTGERVRHTSSGSMDGGQPVPLPSESAPQRTWLRGDLDRIVSTSLDNHPARRYDSVEAFARDIRLYLGSGAASESGPITAPPKLPYRDISILPLRPKDRLHTPTRKSPYISRWS